jgi:hypothetical protein
MAYGKEESGVDIGNLLEKIIWPIMISMKTLNREK